jgi:hypothetical protein
MSPEAYPTETNMEIPTDQHIYTNLLNLGIIVSAKWGIIISGHTYESHILI